MAKIIYAIQSDGLGHYTRSKVIVDYLLSIGHEIKIVTSGKVYELMIKEYDVERIAAIVFHYKNNRIDYTKEITSYLGDFPKNYRNGYLAARDIILKYAPDLIIADFENFSIKVAKLYKIPLICIDNIHTVSETFAYKQLPPKYLKYRNTQIRGIKLLVPFFDYVLITSFFKPEPINKTKTTIIPGILRQEILKTKSKALSKDYILVYQTSDTNQDLLPSLNSLSKEKFIVYGFNQDKILNNVTLKTFAVDQFIKDLSGAKAVITNGGFTLISEALYLKKPILCNPIETQFEQLMNGAYIQKLGYGVLTEKISPEPIKNFLANLPIYQENLKEYQQTDNSELFQVLKEKIDLVLIKKRIPIHNESFISRWIKNIRAAYSFFPLFYMVFILPTELIFLKFKGNKEIKGNNSNEK